MQLHEEQIKSFQNLLRSEFGLAVSDAQAEAMASNFAELVGLLSGDDSEPEE